MTIEQWLIVAILVATVALFLIGRWRHDMVALAALLACVIAGLVNGADAFSGFGHPAVITVACILILSQGLQNSGAIDALTRIALPANAGAVVSISALVGLGALLSGFMNNVGAMALLMPVAVHVSQRLELTAGQVLMPLAFGTILGGMTTLVGTPPNIIVSGFREEAGLGGFGMFDFTPIGLAVAAAGVMFIAIFGWRLVPARKRAGVEGFESGAYITEVRVEGELQDVDAQIIGIVQREVKIIAANPGRRVYAGDILMLEADADALNDVLSILDLSLEESVSQKDQAESKNEDGKSTKRTDEEEQKEQTSSTIALMELVVQPSSLLVGYSAKDIRLRTRYGINLLAFSREGKRSMKRLRAIKIQSGDLLLMQGSPEAITEFAANNGCIPLAPRELRLSSKIKIWQASLIMFLSIAIAALGWLPAAVAFALGALASMAVGTIPLGKVYEAIDWPVVVLLGALIPVAGAMESTGTAELIATFLVDSVAQGNPIVGLAAILLVTMFLSDLMNNAATAAVMCPIAISISGVLNVNPDSFLMAVAIGASCAFLTPIGHQNNTLILGPGGFRFGDYWRLGLPVQALVIAVSMPLLLIVWPL